MFSPWTILKDWFLLLSWRVFTVPVYNKYVSFIKE